MYDYSSLESDNYISEVNNYGATEMDESDKWGKDPYYHLGKWGLVSSFFIFDMCYIYLWWVLWLSQT